MKDYMEIILLFGCIKTFVVPLFRFLQYSKYNALAWNRAKKTEREKNTI